jgi:hypothetical protein
MKALINKHRVNLAQDSCCSQVRFAVPPNGWHGTAHFLKLYRYAHELLFDGSSCSLFMQYSKHAPRLVQQAAIKERQIIHAFGHGLFSSSIPEHLSQVDALSIAA